MMLNILLIMCLLLFPLKTLSQEIPSQQTVDGNILTNKLEGDLERYYLNGVPYTGISVIKHETGQKRFQANYKDGLLHGLWASWHSNGQRKEEKTYQQGLLHGLAITWYSSGKNKMREVPYKDGELHGVVTHWHKNGHKSLQENYKDGVQYGTWTSWDQNGIKLEEEVIEELPTTVGHPYRSKVKMQLEVGDETHLSSIKSVLRRSTESIKQCHEQVLTTSDAPSGKIRIEGKISRRRLEFSIDGNSTGSSVLEECVVSVLEQSRFLNEKEVYIELNYQFAIDNVIHQHQEKDAFNRLRGITWDGYDEGWAVQSVNCFTDKQGKHRQYLINLYSDYEYKISACGSYEVRKLQLLLFDEQGEKIIESSVSGTEQTIFHRPKKTGLVYPLVYLQELAMEDNFGSACFALYYREKK
jgi:hypothetical protein